MGKCGRLRNRAVRAKLNDHGCVITGFAQHFVGMLADGRRVIDGTDTGAALGHAHPDIVAAIRSAADAPIVNDGWDYREREAAADDLASIAEMKDLIFKGTVDEIDVGKLALGLPARMRIGALPNATITGKLTRIAPQATEKDNAKLFEVEIELDPGQELVLRAGYSANADLVIKEKKDILLVPERVIQFEDGGKKAFVEVPGATPKEPVKKVEIATGLSDGLNCEVTSGLKKGDLVVQRPPKPKSDF